MSKYPEGLEKAEDGWRWDLGAYRLARLAFDYAVSLQFMSESAYWFEIRIEGEFDLRLPSGARYSASEDDRPRACAGLLSALHQAGGHLEITGKGLLHLEVGDALQLDVPASKEFEAWTIADSDGINGIKMVSGLDDELYTWGIAEM